MSHWEQRARGVNGGESHRSCNDGYRRLENRLGVNFESWSTRTLPPLFIVFQSEGYDHVKLALERGMGNLPQPLFGVTISPANCFCPPPTAGHPVCSEPQDRPQAPALFLLGQVGDSPPLHVESVGRQKWGGKGET